MGTSRAPRSAHSICHGTRFEWCSSRDASTSSPGPTRSRPNVCATRFTDSVVPRVNTISARVGGAEKAPHDGARGLEPLRGGHAERVDGTVHVAGVARVHAAHLVEHGERLLRGRGAVEVDERVAVHALRERGELAAHPRQVERERAGHGHRHGGHDPRLRPVVRSTALDHTSTRCLRGRNQRPRTVGEAVRSPWILTTCSNRRHAGGPMGARSRSRRWCAPGARRRGRRAASSPSATRARSWVRYPAAASRAR